MPAATSGERSILALNSGSSSVKFALFPFAPQAEAVCRAELDRPDRATAIDQVLAAIAKRTAQLPLGVIGHRIVHGGPTLRQPRLATDDVLDVLRANVRFAPNHLPDEIDLIDRLRERLPHVPQVVCFDTAFHADLPEVASRLAVPPEFAAQGVRRYGFHGLSYTYLMTALRTQAGPTQSIRRVILAHLGNGSSLAAVRDGRSIDTTMGLTPIGGVVMSTRSGNLDPGVVTFMARSGSLDADRLEHELSHRSGLLALSGGTADMRELLRREADDDACRLAVSVYCYGITKQIGAYAAALGGVDAVVFSGGIGEHASIVRARICNPLAFLGIELDEPRNASNARLISRGGAPVSVYVIPTDEEAVIARDAYQLAVAP